MKKCNKWKNVSRTPVFCPVFSLRAYVDWQVLFDMCRHSRLARKAQDRVKNKEFPRSPTCVIASCCLVCFGLHARYTDAFNGSHRFPFRHEHKWYSVLVHVPGIQMVVVVIALDTTRSGEVLMFHLQQWWSILNFASTPGIKSGHRSQGYTAQWLKRLTQDQQVPGSIPGGGHDFPSWRGMTNWLILTWFDDDQHYDPNHNVKQDDYKKVS